jgi:hypothetical protein
MYMDKRLEKRHKRQVARAKKKVKISEPDVRTPEQIEAAREASHAPTGHRASSKVAAPGGSFRNISAVGTGSPAKTDS